MYLSFTSKLFEKLLFEKHILSKDADRSKWGVEKVFLKFLQILLQNTCTRVSYTSVFL